MRVAAVALVATVAFVAAGCGGSSTTSSSSMTPLELVSQAVSKTTKADSAKFRMALTETLGPLGPVTVNAEGTSNTATRSAKMTMDLSSVAQFVGADAGEPGDWQGEVIVDGSNPKAVVEYMRVPAFSKLIPNAKPWLKIDLNTLTKGQGIDFTQFLQTAGGQDPTQALQMLRSVGDVKEVGTEQIDGVDTTKYSGTLDPRKLARKFSGGSYGKMLEQMGTKAIPVTVWLDADGYVRKLEESLSAQVPGTGTVDLKIAANLSDFGTPVSVTPPAADETTDLATLMKK
jgi:hypothetical protein